ncbi:MAG: hypothetical protein HRU01_12575 [Myxococcales bacterium]|nr:hypothetical protein [Myxococcales bacterium]
MSERGDNRFDGFGRAEAFDEKSEQLLHAYHDGELQGRALRRFERRLESSPALTKELELLRSMGDVARELDSAVATPDLWDPIALRLPAEDARKTQEREQSARGWLSWLTGVDGRMALARPLGAVAVAAVAALAVARWWAVPEPSFAQGGVVRWMDSGGRNVMVLEDDGASGTTVIWLLDGGSAEGASLGGSNDVA